MRFFTAASVAFAAFTGMVSAQAATGTATAAAPTGSSAPPTTGGNMGANAIIAPISGASLSAGEDFNIQWINVRGESVTLTLVGGDADDVDVITTIVAGIDNTGSYTWSIPEDLPASSSYSIRISYDNNPNNFNYSDRFPLASDVTSTRVTSAASTTSAPATTSEATSTESETTTEEETSTITSAPSSSTSSMRTSTTSRRSTTTSDEAEPTESSEGAPENAASSNISSPLAIIMAVLAATLFIH